MELKRLEAGDAVGAMHHPAVGDFDRIWELRGKRRAKVTALTNSTNGTRKCWAIFGDHRFAQY